MVRDAYTQGAEDWLARTVETPVAPIIEQLRTVDTRTELVLDIQDRLKVAVFMIEMYTNNVPARRRQAAVVGEMDREPYRPTPEARLLIEDAKREILEDPEQVCSPLVRDARGVHMHLHRPLHECIVRGQWSILYTTDNDTQRHLVTSDDPVQRLPSRITDDFGPLPQGELEHFVMPLSPKRLLVCERRSGRLYQRLPERLVDHPDADIVIRTYGLSNGAINSINLDLARRAWKHVFATRPTIECWATEES